MYLRIIVFFGEIGNGKSSLISFIPGKHIAQTSNNALRCAEEHCRYNISLPPASDTCGSSSECKLESGLVTASLWDTAGPDSNIWRGQEDGGRNTKRLGMTFDNHVFVTAVDVQEGVGRGRRLAQELVMFTRLALSWKIEPSASRGLPISRGSQAMVYDRDSLVDVHSNPAHDLLQESMPQYIGCL